jgi:hypothetical protein
LILCTGKDLKNLWATVGGEESWRLLTPADKAQHIQELGYDSVLAHRWDQWVVFNPEQIRLATLEGVEYAASFVESLLRHLLPASGKIPEQ